MKRTYAFILSGAMLMSLGLTGCSGENTTGVDTVDTEEEFDGQVNEGSLDREVEEDITNNRVNGAGEEAIDQDAPPVMLDPDVGPVDPIEEERPGAPIEEEE